MAGELLNTSTVFLGLTTEPEQLTAITARAVLDHWTTDLVTPYCPVNSNVILEVIKQKMETKVSCDLFALVVAQIPMLKYGKTQQMVRCMVCKRLQDMDNVVVWETFGEQEYKRDVDAIGEGLWSFKIGYVFECKPCDTEQSYKQ